MIILVSFSVLVRVDKMSKGATGTTHTNRECLFRLQTLVIDGGTEVARNLFDQRLPGVTLDVFLANEKKTIKILKKLKTITKAQYNLLYPPAGQLPNSADFDITLIICLLRNLPSLRLNPNYTWNDTPQSTDLSIEADVCRLKGFRNEVYISCIYNIDFHVYYKHVMILILQVALIVQKSNNKLGNIAKRVIFSDYFSIPNIRI